MLKPGGILVAKAINRLASLLDGICRGFIDDPEFETILRRNLKEGRHRGVPGTTRYFTTAYFHRPDDSPPRLRSQVSAASGSTRCKARRSSRRYIDAKAAH